jgi:hypothetical protein
MFCRLAFHRAFRGLEGVTQSLVEACRLTLRVLSQDSVDHGS